VVRRRGEVRGAVADGEPADPRAEFAAALTELRGHLPDLSDEALARRASRLSAPSGRRVTVDARRLGEWLGGRSVPRNFDAVAAIVRAVETALPPGTIAPRHRAVAAVVAGRPRAPVPGRACHPTAGRRDRHRARGRGGVLVWVSASLPQSVLTRSPTLAPSNSLRTN
jgi:hypothetical protein